MKIVTLGPVYPYRGGISHYNSLLSRALAKRHQVITVSFSLQYPDFLYPGKSQKDYANDFFKIEDAHFLLNTVNPLSYVKTAAFIKKQSPDLLIVQWWHPFFAPAYWSLIKLLGKTQRECKLLFVCHNVFPHERFPLQRFLVPLVLKNGDAFIVQSELDERDLLSFAGAPRYAKTVHPTYNAFKQADLSKKRAREILNLGEDEKVLLFFGFVREYKGLKTLISAMPEITSTVPGCRLMIVGDFQSEQSRAEYAGLIEKSGCAGDITLAGGYVPDDQVEKYFAACDAVVLPYDSATQSGIAQIAYGFEKPVIATSVGGLTEVVADGETGFLVPPKDPEKLAAAVVKFLTCDKDEAGRFAENIRREAHRYSWDRMVDVVEELIADRHEKT